MNAKEKIRHPLGQFLFDTRMKHGIKGPSDAIRYIYPDLEQERVKALEEGKPSNEFDSAITSLSKWEGTTIPENIETNLLLIDWADKFRVPMDRLISLCATTKETEHLWRPKVKKAKAKVSSAKKTKAAPAKIKVTPREQLKALLVKYNIAGQRTENILSKLNNHKKEFIDALKALA